MVYRFNWFSFGFAQNKFISTELCAISRPSPVSSSTHLDDPGVVIAAGYVAIPPRDLTDPDTREFSDSLLFESTDTVTGPELKQHLPFTYAPERSQIWAP